VLSLSIFKLTCYSVGFHSLLLFDKYIWWLQGQALLTSPRFDAAEKAWEATSAPVVPQGCPISVEPGMSLFSYCLFLLWPMSAARAIILLDVRHLLLLKMHSLGAN